MEYTLIAPIDHTISPIEQVLINRGFHKEDIHHYLNLTEEDNLSPSLLKNTEEAVKILIKHIANPNSHIHLQVDSDCDGYTSAACLLNYIYLAFPSAISKFSYSFHDDKTHGIDMSAIPEGTTLVIAPDSSSNEYDIHKDLYDKGIDVLVIDHHHAEQVSKYACVVNNQLCDYPNKSLSGVGVVYKVCEKFDYIMNTCYADSLLDLVMLGLD